MPQFPYAEQDRADLYLDNWNNKTTSYMAQFGNLGPVTAHGHVPNTNFTMSLANLPPHTELRYRVYWHHVDSTDGETSYLYLTNASGLETEFLRHSKVYNALPSVSVLIGTYVWNDGRTYSYRPWGGGGYGHDGYLDYDSGYYPHGGSLFSARHYIGEDQGSSDEAAYLSHVRVDVR